MFRKVDFVLVAVAILFLKRGLPYMFSLECIEVYVVIHYVQVLAHLT